MAGIAYHLGSESDPFAVIRSITRQIERAAEVRFVDQQRAVSVAWEDGETGWEPAHGFWVRSTRGMQEYGRNDLSWRSAMASAIARSWLWLRPAPGPAEVLRDRLIERGQRLENMPPLAVAWAVRDSPDEALRALADGALDVASEIERLAAARAVR